MPNCWNCGAPITLLQKMLNKGMCDDCASDGGTFILGGLAALEVDDDFLGDMSDEQFNDFLEGF